MASLITSVVVVLVGHSTNIVWGTLLDWFLGLL